MFMFSTVLVAAVGWSDGLAEATSGAHPVHLSRRRGVGRAAERAGQDDTPGSRRRQQEQEKGWYDAAERPPDSSSMSRRFPGISWDDIPWLTPREKRLPHEGITDLEQLLKVQASGGWITVLSYSRPISRWALNTVYSLLQFGLVHSYVVGAVDQQTFDDCVRWRLPCFLADWALGAPSADEHDDLTQPSSFASKSYHRLVWAKIKIVERVLKLGYNIHFSDVDVVYIRPVYSSWNVVFEAIHPDMIMMKDGGSVAGNTGVYAMLYNNRTLKLVQDWLQGSTNDNDQTAFLGMYNDKYKHCETPTECDGIKKGDKVASVFFHPLQFQTAHCIRETVYNCHPDRLYFHAICAIFKDGGKNKWWDHQKLWLVDRFGQPLYAPVHRDRHVAQHLGFHVMHHRGSSNSTHSTLQHHPSLPCSTPAWWYLHDLNTF